MIDGLKTKHRQAIIKALTAYEGIERAVLFGSRAQGIFSVTSDIDIALFGDLNLRDLTKLMEAIDRLAIPQRVDLLLHNSVDNDALLREIKVHGIDLYRRPNDKSEWKLVTIGDIAKIVGGGTPSTKDPTNFGGGIPWLTPKDLAGSRGRYIAEGKRTLSKKGLDSCSAKMLPRGAVVLSTRAPVGYVAIAKNSIATNQGFRSLICQEEEITPEYLYYWLSANKMLLENNASGTTFLELSGSFLKRISLHIPDTTTQQRITYILGRLDDKIELNRRMNETLEETVRALFKSWFVDFDPVRAKIDGRWQPGQSLPGLPAELYDLFPDCLVPSELGEIPEGWEITELGELVETIRGRSYRSKELSDSDTALVTLKSFARGGGYRLDGLKSYVGKYKVQQVVQPGELIIAMTDVTQAAEVVGRPAIVQKSTNYSTLVVSLDCTIVRPRDTTYLSIPYLYAIAMTYSFRNHTYSRTTGTTVLHLSREAVPSFQLPLPPKQIVNYFNGLSVPIFRRIANNISESETLTSIRDKLLPKLLSSEIRV